MKIDVWSDIICPFCYIGKRRFEEALNSFRHKESVQVEWKSFLLNPEMETDPTKNLHEFLAAHKGISLEEAREMNAYVSRMAEASGLTYKLEDAIPANSFNAHRLLHFAKQQDRQAEVGDLLFRAYFTEGQNIDDAATLLDITARAGLDTTAFARAMGEGAFAQEVVADMQEAQDLGVRGVPFFIFNRKYAVSGAQEPNAFLEVLKKAYAETME